MTMGARDTVAFDLGGVLIDWYPRHLYRKLFAGDEAAMKHFLATVCTHEWNRGQDAGRTFAEGAGLLKAEHPDKAELIDAYCTRFDEMMPGPIAGSVGTLSPSSKPWESLYMALRISRPRLTRKLSSASSFCAGFAAFWSRVRWGSSSPTPAFSNCCSSGLRLIRSAPSISMTSPRMRSCSPVRHPRDPFHDAHRLARRARRTRAASSRKTRHRRDESDRGIARNL